MPQGGHRETEAGRELFLGHGDPAAQGLHVHRMGVVDACLSVTAPGVVQGLFQPALDAVECLAHGFLALHASISRPTSCAKALRSALLRLARSFLANRVNK